MCLPLVPFAPKNANITRLQSAKFFMVIRHLIAGERGGNRTHDPLIKSQMLYLLSYALARSAQGALCPTASSGTGQRRCPLATAPSAPL